MNRRELISFHQKMIAEHPDPSCDVRVKFRVANSAQIKTHALRRPLGSIIIPNLNEVKYLDLLLTSINEALKLSDRPWEVIVADNGSSDKSPEIAADYGVTVISEQRRGIAFAQQAGLKATHSNSKIVAVTGADCFVPSDFFNAHLSAYEDPDVVFTYGDLKYFTLNSQGPAMEAIHLLVYLLGREIYRHLRTLTDRSYIPFSGANCSYLREPALNLGGYQTRLKRRFDGDLMRRMTADGGKIKRVNTVVYASPRRILGEGVWRYARRGLIEQVGNRNHPSQGEYPSFR
jgi:glycosyltransferase involved in cell wall biosynthesis